MPDAVTIRIVALDPELPLPRAQHADDAGCDLLSTIDAEIAPGARVMIPTGIAVAIPPGYAGFVQPRSGLAWKHGVTVLNAPGLIDAGYRGEIKCVLINHDPSEIFSVHRGDRVAQLVIQRVETVVWEPVDQLDDTDRGAGGHGSTGV